MMRWLQSSLLLSIIENSKVHLFTMMAYCCFDPFIVGKVPAKRSATQWIQ